MADAKLIIRPPHMLVRMKPGFWPDIPKMQQTLRDAGYRPGDAGVVLVVTGKVARQGEQLVLELDRMQSPLTLRIVPAKEDAETAEHLARHIGETVEVEGTWQPPGDEKGPAALAVTAVLNTAQKTRP